MLLEQKLVDAPRVVLVKKDDDCIIIILSFVQHSSALSEEEDQDSCSRLCRSFFKPIMRLFYLFFVVVFL
jgi:hypothetical protein